jgi:hypothetical protein
LVLLSLFFAIRLGVCNKKVISGLLGIISTQVSPPQRRGIGALRLPIPYAADSNGEAVAGDTLKGKGD